MALETGSYIHELTITNPISTDPKSQGDDHLRLIKTVLRTHFPSEGAFKDWAAGNNAYAPYYAMYKSRGTLATPLVITTGDHLREDLVFGHDGTQFINAGAIIWQSAGTVATDRIAAEWQLWLHPDSTGAVAKVLAVTPAGVVDLVKGQIKFPATQNASADANTLDDYEEGTWTPVDGSGAGLSLVGAAGDYTKCGNRVILDGSGDYPATANNAVAKLAGIPYAVHASAVGSLVGCRISNETVAHFIATYSNTSTVGFYQPNGQTQNSMITACSFTFTLPYRSAS
jgi:hypothetical protein